jgi:hypothetical protein
MRGFAGDAHAHRVESHFDTCTKTRLLFPEFHEFRTLFRRIPSLGQFQIDHAGVIHQLIPQIMKKQEEAGKGVGER